MDIQQFLSLKPIKDGDPNAFISFISNNLIIRYGSNNQIFNRQTDRNTDKVRYRVAVQLTMRGVFLGGHHL